MIARIDRQKKEVVFLEPQIGRSKRNRVVRPLRPVFLDYVDESDFKFLCSVSNKRVRLSDGELKYELEYDKTRERVYFKINGNVKDTPENFGFADHYDGIAHETQRLFEELVGYRNNGKLYDVLGRILKEAYLV